MGGRLREAHEPAAALRPGGRRPRRTAIPNIVYYHGYFELADDEALVIDVTPPECEYWNFQLNNHWMESLDYRYSRDRAEPASARSARPDGSVRVVVAHRDPGRRELARHGGPPARHDVPALGRRAREHPEPQTRVVKLVDVARLA